MSSDDESTVPVEQQATHRKPYCSPTLSSFGTVTQLTHAAIDMMKDDGSGVMGMNMIS